MTVCKVRLKFEYGAVVDQLAFVGVELAWATQVLAVYRGMLRRGIREARKYRRAASSRNVLKMRDVLRVLLFQKKLLDVVRQIRRKGVRKSPHRSIGIFGPLDRDSRGGEPMVFDAEPEVVAQRKARHQRIAVHAIGGEMKTCSRFERSTWVG